jgi:hypothetical protein
MRSSNVTRNDLERIALTPLTSDPTRAARTRQRCSSALSAHARRRALRASAKAHAIDLLTPVIVAGCCVFYALVLVANALRVEGLIR